MCLTPAIPGWLDDEMHMHRLPSHMRPRADVHLIGLGNRLHNLRYPLQEWTDFPGFRGGEIPGVEAVAEGLDDQGPHSQRPRAMLDDPTLCGVDSPARKWFGALGKPTSITIWRHLKRIAYQPRGPKRLDNAKRPWQFWVERIGNTNMPANPRDMITSAERRLPVRIRIGVPPEGLGERHTQMTAWLDEHCGPDGWAVTPSGTRGVLNDALSIYFADTTLASAFVARWCAGAKIETQGGAFRVRENEPEPRLGAGLHRTP